MSGLSALLLVKHEVETLERAVRSLDGLDAQVVIGVDTRSTDGTRALAHQLTAEVLDIDFTGDFAVARNQLLDRARRRWCLTLDGHEYLDAAAVGPLGACLADDAHGRSAIGLTVRCTEVDGGVRGVCVRVFRRQGSRYAGAIHEQPVGWGQGYLPRPGWTLHHDRPAQAAEARRRQRLDSDRHHLQQMCRQDPGSLAPWLHLSVLELEAGRLDAARQAATAAWSASEPENVLFRVEVALQRAEVELTAGRPTIARRWLDQARSLRWDVPVIYAGLARVAEAQGRLDDARCWLRTACSVPQAPWELPVQVRYHSWWPRQQLSRLGSVARATPQRPLPPPATRRAR